MNSGWVKKTGRDGIDTYKSATLILVTENGKVSVALTGSCQNVTNISYSCDAVCSDPDKNAVLIWYAHY